MVPSRMNAVLTSARIARTSTSVLARIPILVRGRLENRWPIRV